MECMVAQQKLSAYVDGELSPPLMVVVRAHLASCKACAQECRDLSRAWHLVEEIPRVAPRTSLWPGIEERLSANGASLWGFLAWRPLAVSASVVLALAVGVSVGVALGRLTFSNASAAASPVVPTSQAPGLESVRYFADVPPGSLGYGALEITPVSIRSDAQEGGQR